MQNGEWILTKNRVIDKIAEGLEGLGMQMMQDVETAYPSINAQLSVRGFKVSKGEKYQGLPYLILDYPRAFGKINILAIRVLFWWSHFFTITLHTKGEYANAVQKLLLSGKIRLNENVFISHSGNEWNHDISHEDYTRLRDLSNKQLQLAFEQTAFLKLSWRLELMQWDAAEKKLYLQFHEFLKLVELSFLYGETGL